jgi:methylated-DNA-protein-cysteine methyltransferase-like protein
MGGSLREHRSRDKKTDLSPDKILDLFAKLIRKIPRGKVASYGQVAAAAGVPRASRQVPRALRAFRDLPWHRVVGAGGAIRTPGEYAAEQRLRLEMEGVTFRGRRVHMERHQYRFARIIKASSRNAASAKLTADS